MKTYIALILAFFLGWALIIKARPPKLITVNADAIVRIQPDRAVITLGISQRFANLNEGKEKMEKVVSDAFSFCRKNGIKEQFLQTEQIQIMPRYSDKTTYGKTGVKEVSEVLQYDLLQTFSITLEDISKYDNLMYSLLNMGVNRVENINFYSTQMRKYRDDARLNAIEAAKEKAVLLTKAAGIKLGKVVSISENSFGTHYSSPRNMFSNVSQNAVQNFDGDSSGDIAIAAGMIPVKAGVTLIYEVK